MAAVIVLAAPLWVNRILIREMGLYLIAITVLSRIDPDDEITAILNEDLCPRCSDTRVVVTLPVGGDT